MQQRKGNSKKCDRKHNKIAKATQKCMAFDIKFRFFEIYLFSSSKYPEQEQEDIHKIKVQGKGTHDG